VCVAEDRYLLDQMLDGQFKTPSARGARGRRKPGLRFSSRKTTKRNRLQKELKQRECEVVGGGSRSHVFNDGRQGTEECNEEEQRTSAIDLSSLLSTVKELRFESSGSEEEGRGFPHSAMDEVCFSGERVHILAEPASLLSGS
jgi:hypothetical protein